MDAAKAEADTCQEFHSVDFIKKVQFFGRKERRNRKRLKVQISSRLLFFDLWF